MERKEPSCNVGGNINWWSYYEKTIWTFLKKLKLELPYGPAILLLGISLRKMKTLIQKRYMHSYVHWALFIIAKIWKHPKWSLTGIWIKKMRVYVCVCVYIYTYIYIYTHLYMYTLYIHINKMEYFSAIKKNEILPFATTWLEPKGIMLSEISQRKTSTVRFHLYVES